MNTRPIIFSAESVTAILEGRKTQTRRVCRVQPVPVRDGFDLTPTLMAGCPYGKPGDELWVREVWLHVDDGFDGMGANTYYRASQTQSGLEFVVRHGLRWRPSIHMPRWASRITLRLINVRTQRLHDLTDLDARAEGVTFPSREATFYEGKWVAAYADVWDRINKRRPGCAWADNPWVWALTFEIAAAPAGIILGEQ